MDADRLQAKADLLEHKLQLTFPGDMIHVDDLKPIKAGWAYKVYVGDHSAIGDYHDRRISLVAKAITAEIETQRKTEALTADLHEWLVNMLLSVEEDYWVTIDMGGNRRQICAYATIEQWLFEAAPEDDSYATYSDQFDAKYGEGFTRNYTRHVAAFTNLHDWLWSHFRRWQIAHPSGFDEYGEVIAVTAEVGDDDDWLTEGF